MRMFKGWNEGYIESVMDYIKSLLDEYFDRRFEDAEYMEQFIVYTDMEFEDAMNWVCNEFLEQQGLEGVIGDNEDYYEFYELVLDAFNESCPNYKENLRREALSWIQDYEDHKKKDPLADIGMKQVDFL